MYIYNVTDDGELDEWCPAKTQGSILYERAAKLG
jgi:hypothetical protein